MPFAAPRNNNSEFRPFHISPVRQAADTAQRQTDAMSAVQRSLDVWVVSEPVPMRLSSGVRNQNKDSVAIVNTSSGQARCAEANPAATPVNRGTSISPQAPCSRGTIRARLRARCAALTASLFSVIALSYFGTGSCFITQYNLKILLSWPRENYRIPANAFRLEAHGGESSPESTPRSPDRLRRNYAQQNNGRAQAFHGS